MKLQIDTQNKTIKLAEDVKFNELIKVLNKLFPKGEWKEWTLDCNTVLTWSTYPVITYPSWQEINQWVPNQDTYVTDRSSIAQTITNIEVN